MDQRMERMERSLAVEPKGSAYLTADEAADYIKVHVETLRKWVRLGVFPHIPLPGVGKDYRFSRKLIDEWARNRALGKVRINAL
jgi:excisionase family DNA binding protein